MFLPSPARGRVFTASRAIRGTDVTPDGRLRLDVLARYLQEVAEDDVADAGLTLPYGWLLRRCQVSIRGYPRFGEQARLATFCSATGPRWAQRTTTLTGPSGDLMQATALWVAVSRADGRPAGLGEPFHRVYGKATQGRRVSARLTHPAPPGQQDARPWPLRASDFDTAGHVNNTVHWAAVEDVLARLDWLPVSAEIEYQRPILPGHDVRLVTGHEPASLRVWLVNAGRPHASAWLSASPDGPPR